MSTRSLIAKLNQDETFDAVYCHFDGYRDGVGATLSDNYVTEESVKNLISMGDMSTLGKTLDECDFYTNRGEPLKVRRNLTFEQLMKKSNDMWAEYLYIFENNRWTNIEI
jgi:hypothetical protein